MAHRDGQGAVGAGGHAQPVVGELRVVGEVGAHDDDLLAVVAGLDHEVGVWGAGQRHVGAPHDEVLAVEPVAGLGHVGLVAEDLRARRRQVGVPVVEAEHRRAEELVEAGAGAVGQHAHGRDDGEAGDAVGAEGLDRVDVGGGDDLGGLGPAHADHAAGAAGPLVGLRPDRVGDDVGPGVHRVAEALLGLAVGLEEDAAHVRVLDAGGRVLVPAEGGAARAAAGLVLGHGRAGGGVVGALRLPRDDAVLDVDLPGARAGAVHAVGGAGDLVVAPAPAVEGVGGASALEEELAAGGVGGAAAQPAAHAEQRRGLGRVGVGLRGPVREGVLAGRFAAGGGGAVVDVGAHGEAPLGIEL